jgi:hypothetical protein
MNENNKTEKTEQAEMKVVKPDFGKEIDSFIKHIEAQADIVPLVMGLLSVKMVQESKHVDKYIKENGIVEKEENGDEKGKLLIPSDKFKEFIELNEKVETTDLAYICYQ